MLLGSAGIKAVHRTLMKFSPGVNFINIARMEPKSVKKQSSGLSFNVFLDLHVQKLRIIMLVKLTPGMYSIWPTNPQMILIRLAK